MEIKKPYKARMIVINECFQCPKFFKLGVKGKIELTCIEKERVVPDPYKIPKWCPLPNAPEGSQPYNYKLKGKS